MSDINVSDSVTIIKDGEYRGSTGIVMEISSDVAKVEAEVTMALNKFATRGLDEWVVKIHGHGSKAISGTMVAYLRSLKYHVSMGIESTLAVVS